MTSVLIQGHFTYRFYKQVADKDRLMFECLKEEPITEEKKADSEEEVVFAIWEKAATLFPVRETIATAEIPTTIGELRDRIDAQFPTYRYHPSRYNIFYGKTPMSVASARKMGYLRDTWFVRIVEHVTFESGSRIEQERFPKIPFMCE
jgi:hypothetical protein